MRQRRHGWAFVRDVCRGVACDVDLEIRKAYEKYPFPYAVDIDFLQYTPARARQELERFRLAHADLHRRTFGLAPDRLAGRIVWDLAAGTGWRALAMALDGPRELHAFEGSKKAVGFAQHFAQLLGIHNVSFQHLSLFDLASFPHAQRPDLVFCTGALHHIFDLRRVVHALARCCREGTEFYFTHSSYRSIRGVLKYYKNWRCWAEGGSDLDRRLAAGERVWKSWVKSTPVSLRIDQINDLAGVLYVARSREEITRLFREARFDIEALPTVQGLSQHLESWREILLLPSSSSGKRLLKRTLRLGVDVLRALPMPKPIDRALGVSVAFLFEMRPYYFKAIYRGNG